MDINDKISGVYASTGSINATALALGIAPQKARRILITLGLYRSARSVKIQEMSAAGKSADEISRKLSISKNTVLSYLPYTSGPYKGENRTKNALKLVAFRKRHKLMTSPNN